MGRGVQLIQYLLRMLRHVMMSQEGEKEKESSVDFDGRISLTTSREQILYLFDIVASLCAGFNEHDIQFLSSLLALLRGDLSAQVKAERGGGTNRQIWKEMQRDRPIGEH